MVFDNLQDAFCGCTARPLLIDEPMSRHTSFKIGGPADLLATPSNEAELCNLLKRAKENNIPVTLVGNGSNLLVRDKGIRGLVIKLGNMLNTIEAGENSITFGSGVSLALASKKAAELGFTGMEFAVGIPGSIGGAVYMNAGAYGGEFKDVVISCKCLDKDGNIIILNTDELDFSYRHSIFTDSEYCILGATIKLNIGNSQSIKEKMNTNLKARSDKQPLDYPSAGSTFKRPQGSYASLLIDNCKLKGFRVGDAQISEKHAGFVINIGNASCDDVLKLMNEVKNRVLNQTGFVLEPEIKII